MPTRPRLLVVDPNADAAESLALLLQLSGYDVGVANGAGQALAHVSSERPDVVLSELVLPGLDGFRLAAQLLARAPGAVLVALTTQEGEEVRYHARQSGYHHHFVKSGSCEALMRLLASIQPASRHAGSEDVA